jgi:hypothetical protein
MNQYYVTQKGKTVGPWSLEKIYESLSDGTLDLHDYIFHPDSEEWQVILISSLIEESYKKMGRHSQIMNKEPSLQSKEGQNLSSEKGSLDLNLSESEWFLFKNNKQQGPYSYLEVIKLLQAKKLFDYDFVWSASLSTWTKLFEVEAFSPSVIEKLSQEKNSHIQAVFFRRQYPRIEYASPIFLHNSQKLWKSHTHEISAGGCSVILPTEEISLGDKVIVHFCSSSSSQILNPSQSVPAFNALCSVVSKRRLEQKQEQELRQDLQQEQDLQRQIQEGGSYKMGLKFEALNQDIQISLRSFTEGKAA